MAFFKALALSAILTGIFMQVSRAQDNAPSIVPVATTALTALSNETLSSITGTGLQAPDIRGVARPRGPITLWDELRPVNPQTTPSSSTSIVTINGAPLQ